MTARPPRAHTYPFPYFGEGVAQFFQWCNVYVWFEATPSPTTKAAIVSALPNVLGRHSQAYQEWDANVLNCGNGQDVRFALSAAYPTGNAAFEADIQHFLHHAHALAPIGFVVRPEDHEANGTKLGAWHRYSMTALEAHFARMDACSAGPDTIRGFALRAPLDFATRAHKKQFPQRFP